MNFIFKVKILLRNQGLCVLNGGKTAKLFLFETGTHQGDPISVFLFILAFKIVFHLIKSKPKVKRLAIFGHC